jgi:hypothetical protein
MRICEVEGCEKKLYAKGMCEMHYARMRRNGTLVVKPPSGGFPRRPIEDRFWEKVEKGSECWEWQGYRMPNGYGQIGSGGDANRDGRNLLAHRVSWELHHGESVPEGKVVRHYVCDNPRCVNPAHLRLGTQADNIADMKAKGRGSWQKEIIHG